METLVIPDLSEAAVVAKAAESRKLIDACMKNRGIPDGGKDSTLTATHPEGSAESAIIKNLTDRYFMEREKPGGIPHLDAFKLWEQEMGGLPNVEVNVVQLNDVVFLTLDSVEFNQIPRSVSLKTSKRAGLQLPLVFIPKNDLKKIFPYGGLEGAWFLLKDDGIRFKITPKDIAIGDWTIEQRGRQDAFLTEPKRSQELSTAAYYNAVGGHWPECLTAISEMTVKPADTRVFELLHYLNHFAAEVGNRQEIMQGLPEGVMQKVLEKDWIKKSSVYSKLVSES